jgi:hypothetical protein
VQLSEEAERKLADQRMKVWSKDQEEYTDRQFREIEEKKMALKSQAEEDAREKAEIERQNQVAKEKFLAEQRRFQEEASPKCLNPRDEEERLRNERKLEAQRLRREKIQEEVERNPPPKELAKERQSRRDLEWMQKRFKTMREWDSQIKEKSAELSVLRKGLERYKVLKMQIKETEEKRRYWRCEPPPDFEKWKEERLNFKVTKEETKRLTVNLAEEIRWMNEEKERVLRKQEKAFKERWEVEDKFIRDRGGD